jgi:hypothetical protein
MYSFKISFCVVPLRLLGDIPWDSATTIYKDSNVDAVELIVIEVLTLSSGIFWKHVIMLSMELMATPVLPTSPCEYSLSESLPVCVGRSKANDRPVCP